MLSHVSRCRRWWKLFKSFDHSIELSEPMRVELLLSNSRSSEAVCETVVEHYSGVHLRKGGSSQVHRCTAKAKARHRYEGFLQRQRPRLHLTGARGAAVLRPGLPRRPRRALRQHFVPSLGERDRVRLRAGGRGRDFELEEEAIAVAEGYPPSG